jgi:hypothetical protein
LGATFFQAIVHGPTQDEVAAYFRDKGHNATVGPTVNRFTVVGDEALDQLIPSAMRELCAGLSLALACPCLGIHFFDEDVLNYDLYVNGDPVDDYDSCPDYHDYAGDHIPPRQPIGGDVDKLAAAFGLSAEQTEAARAALHRDIEAESIKEFALPADLSGMAESVTSGDGKRLGEAMRQIASLLQAQRQARRTGQAPPQTEKFDKAFPARWRFGYLLEALGAPEYAMGFDHGANEEGHGLPPGSIVRIDAA